MMNQKFSVQGPGADYTSTPCFAKYVAECILVLVVCAILTCQHASWFVCAQLQALALCENELLHAIFKQCSKKCFK